VSARGIVHAGAVCALLATCVPGLAAQRTLRVGAGHFPTISAALEAAGDGDTIRVAAGRYPERLRIERSLTLIGEGWPIVDAEGAGHVVEALAPIEIRGFVLRGSGSSLEAEHSGVIVRGARAIVAGNRLEDVLYGICLKQAGGSRIEGNRIRGKALDQARRGDGIRLWYSPASRVTDNEVRATRDVVAYFSDHLTIERNVIHGGRYGLHTMYIHHSRIANNRMFDNQVGAFLMYSNDILVAGNVLADAAGPSGMGLGLKDSDAVRARGNLFLENSLGVYLDNSPGDPARANEFAGNTFAANRAAVRMLPSVTGNRFVGNDFLDNGVPAQVAGGAPRDQARQNDWSGNYWSDYAGFDRDGDGAGDAPYVHAHLADDLLERRPELEMFAHAPALAALDALVRWFPLLAPAAVVVDPAPRLSRVAGGDWQEERAPADAAERFAGSAAWALAAGGAIGAIGAGARRRERGR
jgi:nitrous oxidase accessory protein